jgi:acetyl-CoA carboxylase beta subunit
MVVHRHEMRDQLSTVLSLLMDGQRKKAAAE